MVRRLVPANGVRWTDAFVGAEHIHAAMSVLVVWPVLVRGATAGRVARTQARSLRGGEQRVLDLVHGDVGTSAQEQRDRPSDMGCGHTGSVALDVGRIVAEERRADRIAGGGNVRLAAAIHGRTLATEARDLILRRRSTHTDDIPVVAGGARSAADVASVAEREHGDDASLDPRIHCRFEPVVTSRTAPAVAHDVGGFAAISIVALSVRRTQDELRALEQIWFAASLGTATFASQPLGTRRDTDTVDTSDSRHRVRAVAVNIVRRGGFEFRIEPAVWELEIALQCFVGPANATVDARNDNSLTASAIGPDLRRTNLLDPPFMTATRSDLLAKVWEEVREVELDLRFFTNVANGRQRQELLDQLERRRLDRHVIRDPKGLEALVQSGGLLAQQFLQVCGRGLALRLQFVLERFDLVRARRVRCVMDASERGFRGFRQGHDQVDRSLSTKRTVHSGVNAQERRSGTGRGKCREDRSEESGDSNVHFCLWSWMLA